MEPSAVGAAALMAISPRWKGFDPGTARSWRTPSLRVVGLQSDLEVETVLAARAHEPWHRTAVAALRAEPTTLEELQRYRWQAAPLLYGRWSAAAQAQAAAEPAQFAQAAADGFYEEFQPDPTLQARLAELTVATLLLVGEHDIWPTAVAVRQFAAFFNDVDLVVQPESGHFPWVDDPAAFVASVEAFLSRRRPPSSLHGGPHR